MTEKEWLESQDALSMQYYLESRVSERRLRLFACARCRQLWHLLTDDRDRAAIELAEQFADGQAPRSDLDAARDDVWLSGRIGYGIGRAVASVVADDPSGEGVWASVLDTDNDNASETALMEVMQKEPAFLRDIFGNPFRKVKVKRAGRTSTVLSLAQAIYDDRTFDRLPILADALEEAGCTDAAILAHCRQGGEHVRGCWVVDLLPGKR